MGGSKREERVLKLVHPGRYAELHTQPVTAAEVMRRNPRHCVARPDVFRFPWIVVRPESVLLPGSVFYIVPNSTIYGLLKARKHQNQDQQGRKNRMVTFSKDTSRLNSSAGMTPLHQSRDSCLLTQIRKKTVPPQRRHEKKYPQRNLTAKNKKYSLVDRRKEDDIHDRGGSSKGTGDTVLLPRSRNGNLQMRRRRCQQVVANGLKSCLRKEDSARKPRELRVHFCIACNNNADVQSIFRR